MQNSFSFLETFVDWLEFPSALSCSFAVFPIFKFLQLCFSAIWCSSSSSLDRHHNGKLLRSYVTYYANPLGIGTPFLKDTKKLVHENIVQWMVLFLTAFSFLFLNLFSLNFASIYGVSTIPYDDNFPFSHVCCKIAIQRLSPIASFGSFSSSSFGSWPFILT